VSDLLQYGSIRLRLLAGLGVLVVLGFIGGLVARGSLLGITGTIAETLARVRDESQLTARLTSNIAQEISAGTRYLERGDPDALQTFRQRGFVAHEVQQALNSFTDRNAQEIGLLARIDEQLSALEVRLALAHRLRDLNRGAEARAIAEASRVMEGDLLADVQRLSILSAGRVTEAATALRADARRRGDILLVIVVAALFIGVAIVWSTFGSISRPLAALVAQARAMSAGHLTTRTTITMPGEFQALATAMNGAADSLGQLASVANTTADDVAASAQDLASISAEIATTAGHVSSAMGDVTSGAENQVSRIGDVDGALRGMRDRAETVREQAARVGALAGDIERTARARREELVHTIGVLSDIRHTVQRASREAEALTEATATIDKFVSSVSRIAEQTNLLALNAAIEAARAGAAGRGFAVVADEVRKLAEQAQESADDIVRLTAGITSRVTSTARAMLIGAGRVDEIETVSRDLDNALSAITASAERTRDAAAHLTRAADENAAGVSSASEGLQAVARTAEQHAAAAEQVGASTEQQSAACQEMTASSQSLLANSARLRDLVSRLGRGEGLITGSWRTPTLRPERYFHGVDIEPGAGRPCVLLLSGGLDSTTLLALTSRAEWRVHALTVRYGQRHEHEVTAAREIAKAWNVARHVVTDIDLRSFGGSALTDDIAVPKDGRIDRGTIPVTYVPARNTVLLSLSLAWAETLGAGDVFIGVNALDYSGYPDCRPEYIRAFESLANLATRAGVEGTTRFRVHAPLMAMTKRDIVLLGATLGVDFANTSTCYDPSPDGGACGACDACVLRRKGFADAGIPDPTRYATVVA
jgi:queuosine biosynthesis protein QueC